MISKYLNRASSLNHYYPGGSLSGPALPHSIFLGPTIQTPVLLYQTIQPHYFAFHPQQLSLKKLRRTSTYQKFALCNKGSLWYPEI